MRNTYYVIGRKAPDPEAVPEFVFFALDEGRLMFTERLMSAIQYATADEAERILKSAKAKEAAGCEVLEVFARRMKDVGERAMREVPKEDVLRVPGVRKPGPVAKRSRGKTS
jgi:hypothetical protein